MKVTLKNLQNLATKGLNVMSLSGAETMNLDNLTTIVNECAGSDAAAAEIMENHTIGEIVGFITASFQPPTKAAE